MSSRISKEQWILGADFDYLMVKDGVLFRECEDVPGKGHNKCRQFVIPQDVVHSIVQQLHDAPCGSHLGIS